MIAPNYTNIKRYLLSKYIDIINTGRLYLIIGAIIGIILGISYGFIGGGCSSCGSHSDENALIAAIYYTGVALFLLLSLLLYNKNIGRILYIIVIIMIIISAFLTQDLHSTMFYESLLAVSLADGLLFGWFIFPGIPIGILWYFGSVLISCKVIFRNNKILKND